jgi:rhodanese-related sulfurtransferase
MKDYVDFLEAKLATEIGPHEAQKALAAGTAVLLDVRSADSRAKKFIPGSLHVPRADLEKRLAEVPKDKTVIAYCSDIGCQASLKATIVLRKNGVDAKHLIGGIDFWQQKGNKVESGDKTLNVAAN